MTGPRSRERLASAALVALVHAALLALLLMPSAPARDVAAQGALASFDVAPPAPPPLAPEPREAGTSGAAGKRARPAPVEAPRPIVPTPPVTIAAPVAADATQSIPGATDAGVAIGANLGGWGSGAGAGGDGSGGGSKATRARRLAGTIDDRDYPRSARVARVEGIVTARFTVGADGRARDCIVARSSGDAALDETTCRLIEQRFRYAPAHDRDGTAVAEERGWQQRWWLER